MTTKLTMKQTYPEHNHRREILLLGNLDFEYFNMIFHVLRRLSINQPINTTLLIQGSIKIHTFTLRRAIIHV